MENKQILIEYAETKKQIEMTENEFKTDTEKLNEQISKLNEQIKMYKDNINKLYESKYKNEIDNLNNRLDSIKSNILNDWPEDKKTIECENYGKFTARDHFVVNIHNKNALIDDLNKRDMLSNGIKTFDTTFIQSLIKAGIMVAGANLDNKKVLSFTQKK